MWLVHLVYAILFPERTRSTSVRALTQLPYEPRHFNHDTGRIIGLSPYTHAHVRDAIIAAKFDDNHDAHRLCARLFDTYLKTHTGKAPITLIPIPLGRRRLRERGYNQVVRILEATEAVHSGWATIDIAHLERVRDTKPQTSLSHTERGANVSHAFTYHPENPLMGTVIIVDDVLTTGATLSEAMSAVSASVPCSAVALAYAPNHHP